MRILALLLLLPLAMAPAYGAVMPTSGGTLDVRLETDPAALPVGEEAKMNVEFINPVTQATQIHIDYFVSIMEDGTAVFGPTDRIHTSEGRASIPIQFERAGEYEVRIDVDGILFNDIPKETVVFAVTAGGAGPAMPDGGGGCLIATAAFGTETAAEVQKLRGVRDGMVQTQAGAAFMDTFNSAYYSFSPAVADLERQSPIFKEAVRLAISPMLASLSVMDGADTEAEVVSYGIAAIAMNIGMYAGIPLAGVFGLLSMRRTSRAS